LAVELVLVCLDRDRVVLLLSLDVSCSRRCRVSPEADDGRHMAPWENSQCKASSKLDGECDVVANANAPSSVGRQKWISP
jgi:hypothetical protein